MSRIIALTRMQSQTRLQAIDVVEVLRVAIVSSCAIALIATGPALPF